jgi:hypothetical protein
MLVGDSISIYSSPYILLAISALGIPPPLTMPLRMLARMAYWLGIMTGRIMLEELSRMRCMFWKGQWLFGGSR